MSERTQPHELNTLTLQIRTLIEEGRAQAAVSRSDNA